MNDTARRNTSRTRFSALMLASLLALAVIATGCQRELAGRSFTLVNEARTSRGLAALAWDDQAATKAQAWAEHLAARNTLAHSTLKDGMTNWNTLGENVSYSSTIEGTHDLFLGSSQHRNTMLSRNYTAVGIGVARNGDRWFVVQVYRG